MAIFNSYVSLPEGIYSGFSGATAVNQLCPDFFAGSPRETIRWPQKKDTKTIHQTGSLWLIKRLVTYLKFRSKPSFWI